MSRVEDIDRVQGLHQVFAREPKGKRPNPRLNVVFVHGLGGGGYSTWNSGDETELGFWPERLATECEECAVWTLNYSARSFDLPFRSRERIDLFDRAAWFLDEMVRRDVTNQPIVFVAHSLGGLVVKQALQFAFGMGSDSWRSVWHQTRAVVFIASPHDGSHLADFAVHAARLAGVPRLLIRFTPILHGLRNDHSTLRYLKGWYRDHSIAAGICTLAFAERREYHNVIVVDASSANPGIPNQEPRGLPEDHISIAKPASMDSPVYAEVEKLLRTLTATHLPRPSKLVDRICGDWWGMVKTEQHESDLACIRIKRDSDTDVPLLEGRSFTKTGAEVAAWKSQFSQVKREDNCIYFDYVYGGSRKTDRGEILKLLLGHAKVKFEEPDVESEWIRRGESEFISVHPGEMATAHDFGTATQREQQWLRADKEQSEFQTLWYAINNEQRQPLVKKVLGSVWGR